MSVTFDVFQLLRGWLKTTEGTICEFVYLVKHFDIFVTFDVSQELIPPSGITAFYAANTTEKSYDHPDSNNGIFTYYMLKGLRGDADNGDKVITVEELHNYIRKNVHDTTKSLYSSLPQTPQLYTEKPNRVLLRLP